jgi:hypothetical protein
MSGAVVWSRQRRPCVVGTQVAVNFLDNRYIDKIFDYRISDIDDHLVSDVASCGFNGRSGGKPGSCGQHPYIASRIGRFVADQCCPLDLLWSDAE